MSGPDLRAANAAWLGEFRAKRGRAPRVLHIGNIANNAYNVAKALNGAGLDCDVICYDYYHLMGCPEWEDADFEGSIADQFQPEWSAVDLRGFRRPRWFAQGPLSQCINYLVALRSGDAAKADALWAGLGSANGEIPRPAPATPRGLFQPGVLKKYIRYLKILQSEPDLYRAVRVRFNHWHSGMFPFGSMIAITLTLGTWFLGSLVGLPAVFSRMRFRRMAARLVHQFRRAYPERPDMLTEDDVQLYRRVLDEWTRLFEHYDIVQAYATDPILALLAGKRPYVAFEHGTLRDFTLRDDPVCRLTSLAYREADHVFITNGDCLGYARKIGVRRYSPMLHPVDDAKIRSTPGDYAKLHAELGVKYLFLCTLRHDWDVKGTDQYIRALPGIAAAIGSSFRVLMTKWGAQLDDSRRLADELGVSEFLLWLEPLPRLRLIRMQKSVDIVFDQIALPHFGATAPEAIAAGVPVIMSYDPASTAWLTSRPAPILPAWNPGQIVAQVGKALDPRWLEEYRGEARRWIDECHNAQIVLDTHLEVYGRLLGGASGGRAR